MGMVIVYFVLFGLIGRISRLEETLRKNMSAFKIRNIAILTLRRKLTGMKSSNVCLPALISLSLVLLCSGTSSGENIHCVYLNTFE